MKIFFSVAVPQARHARQALLLLLMALFGGAAQAQEYSAGFRVFAADNMMGGVWYPSVDAEREGKLGPFRPEWAWDGTPAIGRFPVILFSHGRTGRFRNHRETVATLARAGYVVIAPQHTPDRWVGTRKTTAAVQHRASELSRARQLVAESMPDIAAIMDDDATGAVGYSLGGLTALVAEGAPFDMAILVRHCQKNAAQDVGFCRAGGEKERGWLSKIKKALAGADVMHWLFDTGLQDADEMPKSAPQKTIDFRAIALVAPAGAVFDAPAIRAITAELALFRLGRDEIVRYPFHAEYLHRALGDRPHVYKTYPAAHHFAFISPFPDWLLETEDIPLAMDPEGFDRRSFLRDINADILQFFLDKLPPPARP